MSVHWFEAESAANDWRPGGIYTAPIGGELLSYDVEFALLDGAGRERAAGNLSWDAGEAASAPPSSAARTVRPRSSWPRGSRRRLPG